MNLLKTFEKTYIESITKIKKLLVSENKEIALICHYLLTTDASPASFLQSSYHQSFSSAESFLSFLEEIKNRIENNNEICFPVINGEPKISLTYQKNFNIQDFFPEDASIEVQSEYEIMFLNNISDFVDNHSCYYMNSIKEYFFHYAEIYGVEYAINHYGHYKDYDTSWINEFKTNKGVNL